MSNLDRDNQTDRLAAQPAALDGAPDSNVASESESNTDRPLMGEDRRGIAEWAVVLVLVALIVGVAWSQFGPLFEASTAGSSGDAPGAGGALEVEAEGVVVGGTAMSSLSDLTPPDPAPQGNAHDEGEPNEPDDQE